MNREKCNAVIRSTMLGIEDHGILTCMIHLDYGGSGQGFGGWVFDTPQHDADGAFTGRVGVAFGMEFIRRVLDVLGARNWEDLPGTHVRADYDRGKVHGIGHIIKDAWFYPERDLAAFMSAPEEDGR